MGREGIVRTDGEDITRMDREDIIRRLRHYRPRPDHIYGDHQLNPDMGPGVDLTPAAVLVPLVHRPDGLTIMFTRRTEHLLHHPGQISFPGGHVDAGDASPEATALRETEEEVGLTPDHIDIVGHLDQYSVRTGFSITPVVGLITPPFHVRPDPHEVAEIFEVPLDFLMDPDNHQRHSRRVKGIERHFYAMSHGGHFIWGATAGMLMNLHEVLTNA